MVFALHICNSKHDKIWRLTKSTSASRRVMTDRQPVQDKSSVNFNRGSPRFLEDNRWIAKWSISSKLNLNVSGQLYILISGAKSRKTPTKIISRSNVIVYLNSMSKFNPEYSKVLRWLPHKVVSRGLLVVEPW